MTRSFKIVRRAPTKPTNVVFGLRSAKRTAVTWNPSKWVDGYAVRVNGRVLCRTPRNNPKCTLRYAFGPRSKVTVTAYNDGVASTSDAADYRVSPRWLAVGSVDFAKKSKAVGARARRALAKRAAMLDRNGFSTVLVTGQRAKSEPRRLAGKRANAAGKALKRLLNRRKAKMKVLTVARANQAPRVSRAVLWIR